MRLAQLTIAILVTGALASLPSCWSESDSDSVTRKDCDRLREHLIDVRMQSVTADHAQHRIAIASSLDEYFLSSCVDGMTSSYVECAHAARDSDALAACAAPSAP